MFDARQLTEQLDEERIERFLDHRRGDLVVCHLGEDREVAETAEHDAVVGKLLPVIEAVSCVMRALEEPLRKRLSGDDLPARRPDRVVELREEAAARAVRRENDVLCMEVVERLDARTG